jgi:hypothetical protein
MDWLLTWFLTTFETEDLWWATLHCSEKKTYVLEHASTTVHFLVAMPHVCSFLHVLLIPSDEWVWSMVPSSRLLQTKCLNTRKSMGKQSSNICCNMGKNMEILINLACTLDLPQPLKTTSWWNKKTNAWFHPSSIFGDKSPWFIEPQLAEYGLIPSFSMLTC